MHEGRIELTKVIEEPPWVQGIESTNITSDKFTLRTKQLFRIFLEYGSSSLQGLQVIFHSITRNTNSLKFPATPSNFSWTLQ